MAEGGLWQQQTTDQLSDTVNHGEVLTFMVMVRENARVSKGWCPTPTSPGPDPSALQFPIKVHFLKLLTKGLEG